MRLREAFEARRPADVVLLGEVHDNAEHHRIRLDWLETLLRGQRFALAMEQLDSEHQSAVDALRRSAQAEGRAIDPRALAEAANFDFRGWSWDDYGPLIAFALRRNLPLLAANLSAAQTARIARGQVQPPADSVPAGWSDADQAALMAEIRDGHCGVLPERAVAPMALAQRSRDAHIAQILSAARRQYGLPVVLIAGNGHVRTDLGVPRHLRAAEPQLLVLAVGLLEAPEAADARRFDLVVQTTAQRREDPCEALRGRFGGGAARTAD